MKKRQSFSVEVAGQLKEMIRKRKLKPGDRIPTESELCEIYEVSRTVVREAIMRLSSEGILVARQGIGVFVGEQAVNRFEVDWDAIRTLPQTIMVLELRKAIEVEAAALCAARRTRNDAVEIRRLMEKIDAEHADPSSTKVIYDYRFHLAIAKASKSPYIYELLKYMKPIVTPRVKLSSIVPEENAEKYYEMIHQQHEKIVVAIEESDVEGATEAMRYHLETSINRLRNLVSNSPGQMKEAAAHAPGIAASLVKNIDSEGEQKIRSRGRKH